MQGASARRRDSEKTWQSSNRSVARQQVLNVVLTGGQIHDCQCAIELLSKVKLEGKTVLGDKAFCSARIGDFIKEQGGIVSTPDKANSRTLYENSRRIATRYNKLAVCFLNFIFLAALLIKL